VRSMIDSTTSPGSARVRVRARSRRVRTVSPPRRRRGAPGARWRRRAATCVRPVDELLDDSMRPSSASAGRRTTMHVRILRAIAVRVATPRKPHGGAACLSFSVSAPIAGPTGLRATAGIDPGDAQHRLIAGVRASVIGVVCRSSSRDAALRRRPSANRWETRMPSSVELRGRCRQIVSVAPRLRSPPVSSLGRAGLSRWAGSVHASLTDPLRGALGLHSRTPSITAPPARSRSPHHDGPASAAGDARSPGAQRAIQHGRLALPLRGDRRWARTPSAAGSRGYLLSPPSRGSVRSRV